MPCELKPSGERASGDRNAFASNRDGDNDIYTMRSDGTDVRQLTDNRAARNDSGPAWCPDGTWLVFQRIPANYDGAYAIYTMRFDGTDVRQLELYKAHPYVHYLNPAWSPDGTQIAFTSNRDDDSEIFTMQFDGTGVRQLTVNYAVDARPAWSPDGTRIAFTSDRDGDFEIYTMRSDGTDVRQLTVNDAFDDEAAWSP